MRIWGYRATLGWAFLAFVAGQFGALAVLLWWRLSDLSSLLSIRSMARRSRFSS